MVNLSLEFEQLLLFQRLDFVIDPVIQPANVSDTMIYLKRKALEVERHVFYLCSNIFVPAGVDFELHVVSSRRRKISMKTLAGARLP